MFKQSKAQFAIEFIVLMSFMFLIFVGFVAIVTTKITDAEDADRQEIVEEIATLLNNEIQVAKSTTDGYTRTFKLPGKIDGNVYSAEILSNRELVVNYVDKEHVSFLPDKVCGDIFIPTNEISKENGIVCANANLDETQCQNAESLGLCNGIDDELLPGVKCCCWLRYNVCSPQCSNGLDDEGDGFCDTSSSTCTDGSTPGDPQCTNELDDDETN
jgi:hypothetical protein